jgi:predicted oxidoreductase
MEDTVTFINRNHSGGNKKYHDMRGRREIDQRVDAYTTTETMHEFIMEWKARHRSDGLETTTEWVGNIKGDMLDAV